MRNTNCPNCGAVIDAAFNKCPYCGTSYFDLTSIDFESGKPVYLKIRARFPYRGEERPIILTTRAVPKLDMIEVASEEMDIVDRIGNIVKKETNSRRITMNVSFESRAFDDGTLMKVEVER